MPRIIALLVILYPATASAVAPVWGLRTCGQTMQGQTLACGGLVANCEVMATADLTRAPGNETMWSCSTTMGSRVIVTTQNYVVFDSGYGDVRVEVTDLIPGEYPELVVTRNLGDVEETAIMFYDVPFGWHRRVYQTSGRYEVAMSQDHEPTIRDCTQHVRWSTDDREFVAYQNNTPLRCEAR